MTNGDKCEVCKKFYPYTKTDVWKMDNKEVTLSKTDVVFAVVRFNKPDEFEVCEECYVSGRLESALSSELLCEAYYGFGCGFLRNGQFEKAKSALKKSLEIQESADSLATLGCAENGLGNKNEAIKLNRRALLIRPDHFMASENLRNLLSEN